MTEEKAGADSAPQRPRPLKIMICTPAYEYIKTGCAWSISHAMAAFNAMPYDGEKSVKWEIIKSSHLIESRTRLVSRAFRDEATHILWLDSDMKVPEDCIARLLNHNKLIVGANYPTKELESRPVAYRDDDEHVGPVWTKPESTGLESVSHLGFGLLLTDCRIYDALELPYFAFESVPPDHVMTTGEDVYFCRKLKAAGLDIWLDHDLSQKIAHIGDWEYTNEKSWFAQQTKLELYEGLPMPVDHGPQKAA